MLAEFGIELSGSLKPLLGLENGRGAPAEAKRSGGLAGGVAFTNGIPSNPEPELPADFFVAIRGSSRGSFF